MDAEIPGPGSEPADRPGWREDYRSPVNKEGRQALKACHPNFIPSACVLLPENFSFIPETGCGQSPRKTIIIQMPVCHAKISKNCKLSINGNTISERRNRQSKKQKIDRAKSYISNPYQERLFSIDTKILCPLCILKRFVVNMIMLCAFILSLDGSLKISAFIVWFK